MKRGGPQKASNKAKTKNEGSTSTGFGFGGKLFAGARGFDPITITMQIVAMQLIYYFTLSLSILIFDSISGVQPHLGQLFNPSALDLTLKYSFITVAANVFNILFIVISLAYIVEKANKVLDFTLTIFTINLVVTWALYKFPWDLVWWAIQGALITVTTLLSEYVCLRLETAEIKLSVNHIIEKGKEITKIGAETILKMDKRKGSKELRRKKKDQTNDV